jgi:hypothetical protein
MPFGRVIATKHAGVGGQDTRRHNRPGSFDGEGRPEITAIEPRREGDAMTLYNVKIRFNGRVSWTQVQASSAGHAKQLVLAQYGGAVDVLQVNRA